MKQTKPFSVTLSEKWKQGVREDAKKWGCVLGLFFTTSGKAMLERINPTAQYNYVFRTDEVEL